MGDIDITALIAFHQNHGKKAAIIAVQPLGRYGLLGLNENWVTGFTEKPKGDGGNIIVKQLKQQFDLVMPIRTVGEYLSR